MNEKLLLQSICRLHWENTETGETDVLVHGCTFSLDDALVLRDEYIRTEWPTFDHWVEVVTKCQSTSHQPTACYGTLWECKGCKKMVCCADGTATGDKEQDGLCDACWHERYGVQA